MDAIKQLAGAPPGPNEEPPAGQGQGFVSSQSKARALQENGNTSAGMPWFRMYAEVVDDAKLRLLAYEDRWHYVAILAIKCSGMLDQQIEPGMMVRMVAVKLGVQPRELEAIAQRLSDALLIDRETLQPLGWNERQYRSDTSRDRTRAYRARHQIAKRHCDVTVTAQDTDTDTKEEKAIGQRDAFAEFWSMYPKRVKRKPCRVKWKAKGLDARAVEIIADVRNRIANDGRWLDGFVPDPLTYITQERWDDELQPRRNGSKHAAMPAESRRTSGPDETRALLDSVKPKQVASPEAVREALRKMRSEVRT